MSWALDSRIYGFANPLGYHLGNVVLNAANVCLLFLFLNSITRAFGMSLAIAAVFALVPIHVEAVSWVMGRKDVLSAFFGLLALLAQSHELALGGSARRRSFYLLSILFTGMALLSKSAAVALFVVLGLHRLFHSYLDGSRSPDSPLAESPRALIAVLQRVVLQMLPHFLVTLAVMVWYTGVLRSFGVTGWRELGPTDPEHLGNVALFMPISIGLYVKQLVWHSQASLYYRWPQVEIPLEPGEIACSLAILLTISTCTIYTLLRRRDLAFYMLSFLAFLLPYCNFVYIGIWRADRYLYLSSFCLLAIAAVLLRRLLMHSRPPLRMAIVCVLAGFALLSGVRTFGHQDVWRSNEDLWRYEANLDQPSLFSIQALATLLMLEAEKYGDTPERAALIAESREQIRPGIAREEALGRIFTPYATSEQLQLSRLHYLKGRLLKIEDAPISTQIEHYATAHQLAPSMASTLVLAGAYFDLAMHASEFDREPLMRDSLDFFLAHIAFTRSDPLRHERSLLLLAQNYGQRFPFLREKIVAAQALASR